MALVEGKWKYAGYTKTFPFDLLTCLKNLILFFILRNPRMHLTELYQGPTNPSRPATSRHGICQKNLHPLIFRLNILHRQFHLISTVLVRKNTKNEWKWRNLHRWQKFYTAAGSDGMDKFHLWVPGGLHRSRPCQLIISRSCEGVGCCLGSAPV